MKTYTEQETAKFKAKRNSQTRFDRELKKSVWEFNASIDRWVNNFTRQRAKFNIATKSLTFLNS